LGLLLLWYFAHVLLLVFAGILLAIFLRGLADLLSIHTHMPVGWCLALVIILLFAVITGGGWLMGPAIMDGIDQLQKVIPQAVEQIGQFMRRHDTIQRFLERSLQGGGSSLLSQGTFQQVMGIFSTVIGALTALVIILFNGIYFSVEPRPYLRGAIHLVPKGKRGRAREVLEELHQVLLRWIVGRIISMILVGVLTWLGLWLMGVPGAPALALLAGLASLVPNIGPILSAVPAILAGWTQGPMIALYVTLLYLGIQTVESYFITPLIQRQATALPPVAILTLQLAMGLALGVLGVLLATPLGVVILVLIKMLYVEDVLEDRTEKPA
jgi:predicted PurR-regulated permease PerM